MKKKKSKLLIAGALIGCLTIASLSAYFTDGDVATNEFTVGKVSLDLLEPNFDEENEAQDVTPAQEIAKDPQIKNDGVNDEYVYITVTIPKSYIATSNSDGTTKEAAYTELFSYSVNSDWQLVEILKETDESITRVYAYSKDNTLTTLESGKTTQSLFDYVKVANAIEDTIEASTQDIIINAYAIQTDNILETTEYEGNNDDGTSSISKVWEVIKNANPSLVKEGIDSTLSRAHGYFLSSKATSIVFTNIAFPEDIEISDRLQTSDLENGMALDVSEAGDGSILAWYDANTKTEYISNPYGKIYANEDCSFMFDALSRDLVSIKFDNFDTSKVTNMYLMFAQCPVKTLDVSNFDTSNVITMSKMFWNCYNLESIDVTNFDTSKVTQMNGMFKDCSSLTSLDLSNFDISKVTNISEMFMNDNSLKTIYAGNWYTNNVAQYNYDMFKDCTSLTNYNESNVTIYYAKPISDGGYFTTK